MVDAALTENLAASSRDTALRRFGRSDARFRFLAGSAAFFVVAVFAGLIATLVYGAWPSIKAFGFDFLITSTWNPVTQRFGVFAGIYGTVVSATIAMLIAFPIGIGIAVFLTELCPRPLRRPIAIAIELLAGIPSIVYGIWGLFIFAPFFQQTVQPWIIDTFGNIPIMSTLFAGPPFGVGVFTAGLILSIMILPFISAITREVFETVPATLKEAAHAIGCTTWEVMWNVILPYSRAGVVGGFMLALGRALGETMAVTFVIGNSHRIDSSLFAPGTTISATIANEFTEALGPLYVPALIESGLVLFGITFIVLASAQLMLYRLNRRAGGGSK